MVYVLVSERADGVEAPFCAFLLLLLDPKNTQFV